MKFVDAGGNPQPFSQETLFISVYESCKHRPNAAITAAAITKTITGKLLGSLKGESSVNRGQLIGLVLATLKRFDKTAATVYAAYHPHKK